MIEKGLPLFIVSLIFFSCLAVAELAITEPQDIYNLGDKLFVTATGLRGFENGNLNIDLKCTNHTVNLLKISARAFPEDGGQAYAIPYKYLTSQDLEIENINDIVGKCSIKANLAKEVVESKSFTISNKVTITAALNKVRYNPGDTAILSITAKRANGEDFLGKFKTSNFSSEEGEITEDNEGTTDYKIELKKDSPPGEFFMSVEVFDEDSEGDVLNSAIASILVIVNQVPSSIEPSVSQVEVTPGKTLKVSPSVLDQVGENVEGTISIHLTDPYENKFDFSTSSGSPIEIPFLTNASAGLWKIYFTSNELIAETDITVLGVERINMTVENSVLIVKNIGNINYYGVITIGIGEYKEDIEVSLDIGEEKEFVLEAPEGEYDISVGDGEYSFIGTSFLTGNAVNVRERGTSVGSKLSLMWVFVFFLGGSFLVVMVGMYRRSKKSDKTSFKDKIKGFSGFHRFKKNKKEEPQMGGNDFVSLDKKSESSAESSIVKRGEKLRSIIISVKLKDKEDFSEEIQNDLVKIIKESCTHKGVIDVKAGYIYLIYSPLITRTYKNEFEAVRIALNIKKKLNAYASGLSGELKFGIGVNSGELISQKVGHKLKYTSIGTIFSTANKMAEEAKNDVYIFNDVRTHLLRDLKTKKVPGHEHRGFYQIDEIKDKEANKRKLDDLLSRMNKPN